MTFASFTRRAGLVGAAVALLGLSACGGGDETKSGAAPDKIVYDGPSTALDQQRLIEIYGPEFEDAFWETKA